MRFNMAKMCKDCYEAAKELYPSLDMNEINELLWSATCYPAGDHEQVKTQLIEAKENTDGTLNGALAYAAIQMDKQYEEFRKMRHNRGRGF